MHASWPQKPLAILLIVTYLAIGAFVLAGFLDHRGMIGCPLGLGKQAICRMEASEHVAALQALLASTEALFFSLALLRAARTFRSGETWRPPARAPCAANTRDLAIPPPLQALFSAGILHPKAP